MMFLKSASFSAIVVTSLAGLTAIAKPAQASLIGDTINIQGALDSVSNVTVIDPGFEYQEFLDLGNGDTITETIDVFAEGFSIDFDITGTVTFTGDIITLSGLDWLNNPLNGVITDVSLVSGDSNVIADISFSDSIGLDSGSITVTFTNGDSVPDTPFIFDIETSDASATTPEPSSVLALLGLGLGVLATKRKK